MDNFYTTSDLVWIYLSMGHVHQVLKQRAISANIPNKWLFMYLETQDICIITEFKISHLSFNMDLLLNINVKMAMSIVLHLSIKYEASFKRKVSAT